MTLANNYYIYYQIQKVRCYRQSGLVYTYVISVTLSYKHIPRIEVAYTNCLAGSLDIYIGRTPVPDFGALFAHLFVDGRPYYSGSLSLNRSIDLTSIGL